jgi:hypothetical protein
MPDDARPPDLVPGDSRQPSNQPIEDESRSCVLHDADDASYVVEQQTVGAPDVGGGGEWPDPDAPPRAPAPGSDPQEAAAIAAERRIGGGEERLADAQEAAPVAGGSKSTAD